MNILFLLKPKNTVAFLTVDSTLRQGLEKMRAHGYTAIPVLSKDGHYIGTVSEGDFLWRMLDYKHCDEHILETKTLREILRTEWNPPVKIDAAMDDLLLRVMGQNFVPVIDDRGLFIGIITRRDVIKYFYDKEHSGRPSGSAPFYG